MDKIVDIIEKFWTWRKVILIIIGVGWLLLHLDKLVLTLQHIKELFGGKNND